MPFIDAARHRIEYERIGDSPGSRPSLVFLHEGLGSITGWGDFPGRLARATGLAGVAYNRAGHGRSGPLTGPRTIRFMHDEALDVLPSVLSSLGVERPILIGHSDGASIALIFASHHPSLVRGLALEAPHVIVEPETAGGIADARRRFRAGALRERLRRHHFENTESMFETWAEVWLSDAFRTWSIQAELGSVRCPVFVVQGDNDGYGTMEQVRLVETGVAGPATSLVLPGCGHAPHRERTGQVVDAMRRFIASLD